MVDFIIITDFMARFRKYFVLIIVLFVFNDFIHLFQISKFEGNWNLTVVAL